MKIRYLALAALLAPALPAQAQTTGTEALNPLATLPNLPTAPSMPSIPGLNMPDALTFPGMPSSSPSPIPQIPNSQMVNPFAGLPIMMPLPFPGAQAQGGFVLPPGVPNISRPPADVSAVLFPCAVGFESFQHLVHLGFGQQHRRPHKRSTPILFTQAFHFHGQRHSAV